MMSHPGSMVDGLRLKGGRCCAGFYTVGALLFNDTEHLIDWIFDWICWLNFLTEFFDWIFRLNFSTELFDWIFRLNFSTEFFNWILSTFSPLPLSSLSCADAPYQSPSQSLLLKQQSQNKLKKKHTKSWQGHSRLLVTMQAAQFATLSHPRLLSRPMRATSMNTSLRSFLAAKLSVFFHIWLEVVFLLQFMDVED